MSKDFYKILDISKSATEDEIKSAYRKKAMKYHPDRNPDNPAAEQKFKEATEAYEVLSNSEKRAMYDRGGYNPNDPQGTGGFGGFGGFGGNSGFNDFGSINDIFEEFFGANHSRRGSSSSSPRNKKGSDLLYNLSISLEEAYFGVEKEITINNLYSCTTCNGSGSDGPPKRKTCSECGGKGKVRKRMGFFSVEQACTHCKGQGEILTNPCRTCHGEGRVKRKKTLSVNIPSGIDHGMRIKLSGEGEAGVQGAIAGDLFVSINTSKHKTFKRKNNDLYMDISINMIVAVLGGTIKINTLQGGEIELKIPEGINNGQTLRVRNKGMKILNQQNYGDLYVNIKVETLQKLTEKEKKVLSEAFNINEKNKYKIIQNK